VWRLCLAFFDIALHRRGPEDLPASRFLLGLILAVYFVAGVTRLGFDTTPARAVVLLALDRVLYLGMAWLVLKAIEKRRRFLQTATALVGTDTFLIVLSLPVLLWDDRLGAPPTEPTLPRFLSLVIVLWSIDIGGFIMARAVSQPYVVGLAIMIVYALISMYLQSVLFPRAD
jgi:hypothetical protein